MIQEYIQAAMEKATYEIIKDEEPYSTTAHIGATLRCPLLGFNGILTYFQLFKLTASLDL